MILSVEEVRDLLPQLTDSDSMLELKLSGLEQYIRGMTNNNFERYRDINGVVQYPMDIRLGVIKLLDWEHRSKAKAGIASETISRYSVTYRDTGTGEGYPDELLGFLKPYQRARF